MSSKGGNEILSRQTILLFAKNNIKICRYEYEYEYEYERK